MTGGRAVLTVVYPASVGYFVDGHGAAAAMYADLVSIVLSPEFVQLLWTSVVGTSPMSRSSACTGYCHGLRGVVVVSPGLRCP